jgi:hypothetical protein
MKGDIKMELNEKDVKVPIRLSITPTEYELIKNIAEVEGCSRVSAARLALYRGLQVLRPMVRLPEDPPHIHLFRQ